MKTKRSSGKGKGFGLQMDIEGLEAVVLVRVTSPRRLDVKALGETLMKFLRGGYKTLVLSTPQGARKKMDLLEFLGQLQATFTESRYRSLESGIRRQTASPGLFF